MTTSIEIGAIVLCGGKSSRMGQPKHLLPFGNEFVLQRVVRELSGITTKIVIVAAPDQEIPPLPVECQLVRDEVTYQGPLSGLMYGMQALENDVEAAYLSGCDVPLLKSEFVKEMVRHLDTAEIAVPFEEKFLHPLASVYRTSLRTRAEELIAAGERRPRQLIESSTTHYVPCEDLRGVDQNLDSLRNMNTPEAYAELLEIAGVSEITERRFPHPQ
ncbi:molybdenum cofactor guanylyltransferase [Thalassoglobus polymorphus]|uniref:Probable molybdenum cofactor guanylyltransferase n=1 Tax=Thalassoglobus polymorphus TaxID=2527994 RepID=A0A517QPV1_9PLAN|nr:molybdenum cofactor guanylyltransferase [Thalassoglobus polymorphus]QDT33624.1 putative molybdenum cofactor guanylyltransferase [Thalassoglobus polymorphus]